MPQFRDLEVQRAQARVESTLSIAVAPGRPVFGPLVTSSSDHAFDIGFHDHLKDRLGDGAQKITLILLLQELNKVHVGLGHRGFHLVRG